MSAAMRSGIWRLAAAGVMGLTAAVVAAAGEAPAGAPAPAAAPATPPKPQPGFVGEIEGRIVVSRDAAKRPVMASLAPKVGPAVPVVLPDQSPDLAQWAAREGLRAEVKGLFVVTTGIPRLVLAKARVVEVDQEPADDHDPVEVVGRLIREDGKLYVDTLGQRMELDTGRFAEALAKMADEAVVRIEGTLAVGDGRVRLAVAKWKPAVRVPVYPPWPTWETAWKVEHDDDDDDDDD